MPRGKRWEPTGESSAQCLRLHLKRRPADWGGPYLGPTNACLSTDHWPRDPPPLGPGKENPRGDTRQPCKAVPGVLNPHPRAQQRFNDREVVACSALSLLGSGPVKTEERACGPAAASFWPRRGLMVCSRLSLNKPSPGAWLHGAGKEYQGARGPGRKGGAERGAGGRGGAGWARQAGGSAQRTEPRSRSRSQGPGSHQPVGRNHRLSLPLTR